MAIISSPTSAHWNYFLSVEEDLIRLSRFIEFHKDNHKCFSIENTRILISAAAETDVVCKQICKQINPASCADDIKKYRKEIVPKFPIFSKFKVELPRYGITLIPWDNWNYLNKVPDWWTAYNKMKHHRDTHYREASLQNVINSVAGLFVACLYLYKDKAEAGQLKPSQSVLVPAKERISDWFISANGWKYNL